MKKILPLLILVATITLSSCSKKREGAPKVLVFSKTAGFVHASIPAGIASIQKLGSENGFVVDTTTNAELFNEDNLKQYSAVIFLSTTGNVLDHYQEAAFERYIQAGGGFVGIHAAADTEYDWGWYNKLVGAYFLSHPRGTPEADFIIKDKNFVATEFFTDTIWHRTDELYNYKKINPNVNVLITLDESTYEGGMNGDFHPIAWYHDFDGGRAFYTGGGHTDESFSEALFLKHILGGIQYAIGDNEILNYKKASSQIPPAADRFSKVMLTEGKFYEPTEMTVLPNNDVLISQRRGEIMLYKADTREVKEVAKLDVYFSSDAPGVNAEEGVLGLQKDPDFAKNNWVYVFYSPAGSESVNRLSRFKFKNDVFDVASEQVILDVGSQRDICCHTGGSIAFGPDGLLYVSTGDNSTPFNERDVKYVNNGYAPLNDSPGHEQYDARRSSGNTNDLRGKILRIKVNEDGSYDIPAGNLFPVGTEKTRPEIYTMGHRNPYRISIDMKRNYLYWGDVGPDSRADSLKTRGPRGYDEVNQAKKAGNYGWPLFIANNIPYVDYNYETGESGLPFNPEKPINNSRNNTGLTELPKAEQAYIYYDYVNSQDFPQTTSGGRNAMAGPTYYSDMYEGSEELPSYYDGKLMVYDWVRGWMFAVHLNDDGSFSKMEPFASDITLNALIDMEVGPDGRVYLLEYGNGWFTQNADSGLSYIQYKEGNRPPVVEGLTVDVNNGKLPLAVTVKVEARDREKDPMTYTWDLGNGETKQTNVPELNYTYAKAGDYKIVVEVKDDKGEAAKSEALTIVAGNSRPELKIDIIGGNSSFFLPGSYVAYDVTVTDPDGNEKVNNDNIFVSVDYLEQIDNEEDYLGHQEVSAAATGKALTQSMDCKACHKEAETSIGPKYIDVAEKYKNEKRAISYLQQKIVSGSSGVWGEVMMPAHPNITLDESSQIASYIMALADDGAKNQSLPAQGKVKADPKNPDQLMRITATYTDEGEVGAIPLTGSKSVILPSSTVAFKEDMKKEGVGARSFNGGAMAILDQAKGWFELGTVDLTGVKSVILNARFFRQPPKAQYAFEVRLNAPDGPILGRGSMPKPKAGERNVMINVPIKAQTGQTNLYVIYTAPGVTEEEPSQLMLSNASFN
ncbi:ThuA domain-containing protein [Confluentibacter flavum]|uniref:Crp/Fnr family transcriptional regulator n=1 Tax=Confluentibacter flavum TaxID=1909700 RepID=A0A2N3HHM6_9FLAO|nr:ThuA domain-containing protein [Confluentibacter flavum]PKQ44480.1 Crp/Fnr family transcriptional regulator [Confluentibacter flavum]